MTVRAVVLVEGHSDQVALEALAKRRGRDLATEGISIVPVGGSKSVGGFLKLYGPQGMGARMAGLCDAAEEGDFLRGLEREPPLSDQAARRWGAEVDWPEEWRSSNPQRTGEQSIPKSDTNAATKVDRES